MSERDQRVDAYIANASDFAQPILLHLRELVHSACPEIKETIKWGFPNFEYKGPLCSMAAFKKHCAFTFWKASAMEDNHKIFAKVGNSAMGHLGRIEKRSDLPPDDILLKYLKEAVRLNEEGVKVKPSSQGIKRELEIPEFFKKALQENEAAKKNFEAFSPSHKKEYIEWMQEAKTSATQNKRLATALEWIAQGKGKNWKYK